MQCTYCFVIDDRIDLNDSRDGGSESESSSEGSSYTSSHSFGSTSSDEEIEENVNYDSNHGLDDQKVNGIQRQITKSDKEAVPLLATKHRRSTISKFTN